MGANTTYGYFYKPALGASGATELALFDAKLDIADAQIEANRTGTDDAGLLSIAGLTTAADKMIYTTALDTYAVASLTAFARTILDDVDAAAVRATIGATGTVDTSGTPVDNDYAKFTDANTIEGRSYSEVRTDLGLVIGTNVQAFDNALTSISGLTYVSASFIKLSANDTYVVRTIAEVKTDLSLNLVENTALSTWAGTANITTLGTITTGTLSTGAIIGGVTMTLGSDADGDIYYRTSGVLTRLAKGTNGHYLKQGASIPEWAAVAGGGDVSVSGTPVDSQIAVWTDATTIEGAASLTYDGSNLQLTGDIGATGARITKGWFANLETTGDLTVNGTALASIYAVIAQTMYIGTTQVAINRASAALTLAGITLTTPDIGTPSAGTLTNCTFPTLNQNTTGSAATLTTARTIGGVSFNGSANITVATATGGFTISGGALALTTNSITMSGSIGVTGTRVTKLWADDIESTNDITIGGTALAAIYANLGANTDITSLSGITGAIATPTNISMTGELDITGALACIDLNPAQQTTKNIIDLTPTATINATQVWCGLNINGAALDPNGVDVEIIGYSVDFSGVSEANAPIIHGAKLNVPFGQDALHIMEGQLHINAVLSSTAASEFTNIDIVIDSSALVSTSEYHAIDVATTGTPSGDVVAIGTHFGVDVIHQHISTFTTPSQTEFAGIKHTGGTVWADGIDAYGVIFVAVSDAIYIGGAAQFDEIEVIMTTGGTKSIQPTFWYNTAADAWTQFFPADDTDGFQQSGEIRWNVASITATWTGNGDPGVGDTTAGYWIKIVRTRVGAVGSPDPATVKIGLATEYSWDKDGVITAKTFVPNDEVDFGAHSVGFTLQTLTGDGTDDINWKLGNYMLFTCPAGDETFTFTAPSNPCALTLQIKQDGTGGRDITLPAAVKWLMTEPTWSDGGVSKTIIMSMRYDGTNYWSQATSWEA